MGKGCLSSACPHDKHLLRIYGKDTAGLMILDQLGDGPVGERAGHPDTDGRRDQRRHHGGEWLRQSVPRQATDHRGSKGGSSTSDPQRAHGPYVTRESLGQLPSTTGREN